MDVMYWMPPIRTKITAMVPLTKMMALRILWMTVLISFSVPVLIQPLAFLTDSGILESQLEPPLVSSAKTGTKEIIEKTAINEVRMIVLNLFDSFM